MKKYILLFITLLLTVPNYIIAQNQVKGFVYEDINRNGLKDKEEKGIAGVGVSNGINVVKTGAEGEYSLPVGNDNIVFVIKPSDYYVPANSHNQPQFFYIHKPKGSPRLQYQGVSPTGPLPKSVNFGLIPYVVKNDFRILVFGDPQPYNEKEVDYFLNGIVSDIKDFDKVAFGISLGDLVGDNLDLFMPYKNAIKYARVPWYNVMGNHDENYDVVFDSLADETFEREFGPANYSLNHGKVHFIILDDILYPDPRGSKGYWGGFREDQFKFIENDLKFVPKDYLVVLAFHIPLSEFEGGDSFNDNHRNRLFKLLKDFPNTLSLSAHTHWQSQDFFTEKEGWLQEGRHHHMNVGASCGDWYSGRLDEDGIPLSTMRDGTPKGYIYLNFSGNKYTFDYKVAGKPFDHKMGVFAPKIIEKDRWPAAYVWANFFIGSRSDTLWYRIDTGDWKLMDYTYDYDPAYLKMINDWDYSDILLDGRRPSNPDKCNHLWKASIPKNIEAGIHIIEIKAKDMFGREYFQSTSYEIAEKDD
ncbi:MAG: calcineurin-like phosphoesterase family protein [Saprospiraceae bacterium]|nr:calcineurin-like phosphoesterase family protein [Saprospiraceae bacterium]